MEVQNPSPYTKPFPLEVVYSSHKCMKISINRVDGSREAKPSYNGIKVPLLQQGNTNDWHAKVAVKGGGSCEWTLSEFNLGIEYIDATHLGKIWYRVQRLEQRSLLMILLLAMGNLIIFQGTLVFHPYNSP
ncbi:MULTISPECIES: hypothetical protein [Rahnella]|uniref:hypothetical protein n=1 Tax=Rahnella TaxID=34037 RepID=UPI001783689A|nr:hypothetical protein [Rahnella aceris]MDP9705482.1 hypothetical protein [Rahnella aquatilis]